MAEQGRYDRDDARGSYYGDDSRRREPRGRADGERGGDRGGRSDRLFGSEWSEREERGWGSAGSSSGRDEGHDRGRDRDRGSSRGGSWFGGSDREDDSTRGRNWERVGTVSARERGEPARERDLDRGRDHLPRGRADRPDDDRNRSWFAGSDRDERSPRDRDDLRGHRDTRAGRDREAVGGDRDRESDRGYGADDGRAGLPIDETDRLIASNKVEGTAVYGLDGERLGSIYNFMVDKYTGKADYAVMTYGGFLGMGTRYYPVPWQLLKYDTRRAGYRVDLTTRDLERAPSFDRSSEPSFDRGYRDRVYGWYGLSQ